MKKNLLFVIPSLIAGGGQKSLVNLLYQLDYDKYNVDLFLFSKTGVFIHSLPDEVNILNCSSNYRKFTSGLKNSLEQFIKCGQLSLAYSRLMFMVMNRLIKSSAISEQYTWKFQSKSLDVLDKEYDAAIGFLEKSPIYFIVDKVKAKRKIGWIHTNYSQSGMDHRFDNPYFKQLDHIVTVSEKCGRSLEDTFHHLRNKIKVIYNIVSPRTIYHLSTQEILESYDGGYTNIVTVARLSSEKGIDMAIGACKHLLTRGYKVRWYVVGDGQEKANLQKMIEAAGLRNNFILLGIKDNPYPYIEKADIYVQPSRYEGKSIAIDEAKILHKPIVVTNYETAKDQIQHGVNGIVAAMNEEGISSGIEAIISDKSLRDTLVSSLHAEKLGTEEEIHKLYEIFN